LPSLSQTIDVGYNGSYAVLRHSDCVWCKHNAILDYFNWQTNNVNLTTWHQWSIFCLSGVLRRLQLWCI